MIAINSDITNTFGFAGAKGYGPSNHRQHELLSTSAFSKIAQGASKIGWLSGYNIFSDEGHISCFYGSLVFRRLDGTMTGFLDSTISNYGINLPYDATDTTTFSEVFNIDTSDFEIPLIDELMFESYTPHVTISGLYNDTSLAEYRPVFNGYNYIGSKYIKVYLYNFFTGDIFTASDYTTLGERDLRIQVYGFKHIPSEDL